MSAMRRLTTDPLFVGATRPPMRWGVTYSALLFNLVLTLEVFLLTRNLLLLFLSLPVHGVCMLLCGQDPRYFDLLGLWARTRLLAHLGNWRIWQSSSYSSLDADGNKRARRTGDVPIRVSDPVAAGGR